jgi:hypothetical protein
MAVTTVGIGLMVNEQHSLSFETGEDDGLNEIALRECAYLIPVFPKSPAEPGSTF